MINFPSVLFILSLSRLSTQVKNENKINFISSGIFIKGDLTCEKQTTKYNYIMSWLNFSWIVLALPFVGCTTIPTSLRDKRLANYNPKIVAADAEYDPMSTPIAEQYKTELTHGKNVSGATLIEDGMSAFFIRAAFARMATKTIDIQTYIYSNDFSSRILIGN